jgi:hypothetical protein
MFGLVIFAVVAAWPLPAEEGFFIAPAAEVSLFSVEKAAFGAGLAFGYDAPPKLGPEMFYGVSGGTKTVTVNVPSAALSAYGPVPANTTDDNWGNAFRGKGWNGSLYLTGTVNGSVSLVFTPY